MKKFLCVLLSLAIVISLFIVPFTALAAGSQENNDINSFIDGITELSREYDAEKDFEIKKEKIAPFSMDAERNVSSEQEYTLLDFQTARLIVRADGKFDIFGAKEHISGFEDFHILQYESPEAAMSAYEQLQRKKNVTEVTPDLVCTYCDHDPENPDLISKDEFLNDWSRDRTQSKRLQDYLAESDILGEKEVVVGVVDTGIDYNHEIFEDRVVRTHFNSSAFGKANDEMDSMTQYHGTTVSSIIINNSPENVKVAVYKVDDNNDMTITTVCAGFLKAIEDQRDVINLSITSSSDPSLITECVLRAYSKNIPVFAAVGNSGMLNPFLFPANIPECIAVSATDSNNTTTFMNTQTPYSDISAPGEDIAVAIPGNQYAIFSGTSYSSPYAATLGAILKVVNPKITVDEIDIRLKETSLDVKKYGQIKSPQSSCIDNYYSMFDGIGMIQFCNALGLEKLTAPKLNLEDKVYVGEQFCEITCPNENATILYTTDGTYPALENATVYTEAFKITQRARIRAVAYYADSGYYSDEVEATPRIQYIDSDDNFVIDNSGIITRYAGDITDLYVPDTINGITVTGLVKGAFRNLIGLTLPETITEMPAGVFSKDSTLEYICGKGIINVRGFSQSKIIYAEFPVAKEIDGNAFYLASQFLYGYFPNVEIINDAFSDSGIISFYGPSVKEIDDGTFGNCTRLESVYLPQCTTLIELWGTTNGIFENCRRLTSADIPLITSLSYRAFEDTLILKADFTLVKTIGQRAFFNCKRLEYINMPSLLSVPKQAFNGNGYIIGGRSRFFHLDNVKQIEEDAFGTYPTSRIEFSHLENAKSLPQTENCIIAMPSTFTECTEDTVGRNYKVYGTKGTYAEQWANENGHEFIEVLQETALFKDVPMEYTGDETLTVDVIGFNRTYQWYSNTVENNESGTPIEGATDKEFNPADYPASPYYYCVVTSTDVGYDPVEIRTGVTANKTYSETILNPMSSQIRFQRNEDGSYANKFDIRTRAKITDEDFAKYIAETNEEAVKKISKAGFVYSKNSTDFSIADAQKVAKGETVSGYVDAPVSYIQDADGYYMFTCIITDIPVKDVEQGVTAYAYICVEDKWYFYNAETTTVFKDLYEANYSQAAKAYGW